MDADDLVELAERTLGFPLGSIALGSLAEAAGGDRRAAADLLGTALASGAVHARHGVGELRGEWPLPSTLAARVESELRALSPRAREVIELAAIAGTAPGATEVRLDLAAIGVSTGNELVARGLAIATDAGIHLAPSPIPFVLRRGMSLVRRRALLRRAGVEATPAPPRPSIAHEEILAAARGARLRGDVAAARRLFADAEIVATANGDPESAHAALAGLAVCAAMTGAPERDALAAEVAAAGAASVDAAIAAAWAAAARSCPSRAVAILRGALDAVQDAGAPADVIVVLWELARFSALTRDDVATAGRGDLDALSHEMLAAVRAIATGDVDALERAERGLAIVDAPLLAAEAASVAAVALRRAGSARRAARAIARVRDHLGACPGVRTPLLVVEAEATVLSPRERVIVRLVAVEQMTSTEVAGRLGCSVRTVSNHLQSIYVKVGVTGRDQLRDLCG